MRRDIDGPPHRVLIDELPLVTYVAPLDAPWSVLSVSPKIETLLGFPPDVWTASESFWLERVVPDDREAFLATFDRVRTTREPTTVEYRMVAEDGRVVWLRDLSTVASGLGGEVFQGCIVDVTREKELEQQLAAAHEQAEAFFSSSSVGLLITDSEGRFVRVNDALARLSGMPAEAHLGKTLVELSPVIGGRISPFLAEVRRTGRSVDRQEVMLELPDRGGATILLSYFPIGRSGEARNYGGVVVDITEQRRAELERADATREYRRLIEQLPLVTYVNELQPRWRATYVSPQIEELFGYPAERWLADPELGNHVVHPDDVARVREVEGAARARNTSFELEYRVLRADGEVRWVLDLMETVLDADGAALFEQGFLVDITERKLAEDAQRESERQFQAVFDNALEAMLIADDEGRYVDANPAACALLGRTRDELLGLSAADVSLPDMPLDDAWRTFLEAGEAAGSHVIVRPDGSVRETEFAARANILPGRHLSVMRDVTRRKDLERDLRRAQRLESIGRLAGGVAHDFNNLLTAIRGYTQLLLHEVEPGTDGQRYAEEVERAAKRATTLTAQLLAFGRRQVLQPRPVDVNRLLDDLTEMLRRVTAEDVEIVAELDPALHAVRVDPAQIDQVIVNLVANAADAMAEGGRIVVRTQNVELEHDPDAPESDAARELPGGTYVVLSVSDTGPGIDESTREHLFEPFFTTKDVGEGSGLGLATAYGIAKQSGGTIGVESAPGAGSTFSVYLPVAEDAAVERSPGT